MRTSICAHIQEELPLYVGGDLQGRRARRIAKHVRDCANCLMSADELQAMREDFRLYAAHPPPSVLDERVFAEIRSAVLGEIRKPPRPHALFTLYSRVRPFRLALAASCTLLLLSATLLWMFLKKHQVAESAEKSAPSSPIATPVVPRRDGKSATSITATIKSTEKVKGKHRLAASAPRKIAQAPAVGQPPQTDSVSVGLTGTATPYQLFSPNVSAAESENLYNPDRSAEPEQLRIELQTKDPDVRIIWISLKNRE